MTPLHIKLHKKSRSLELHFSDGQFELSAEYLRVHSPSAEVRGHGVGQEVLQHSKKFVAIDNIEMSGNYALKITFDDGHDSGLYTWDYLYTLCHEQARIWQTYLDKLEAQGKSRDAGLIGLG
ncbi:MAG: gamma-butyrobetaine hydroxylase-like domain-containing protein [Pseudomonadales bacterium]